MDKTMPNARASLQPRYLQGRRRPMPKWKQAEEYFKVHRDPKLPVSLPRLKCLESRHG